MNKQLIVKTDIGTFSRRTARTYTHIVVVKGFRSEKLEASRVAALRDARESLARYEAVIASGVDDQHPTHCAEWLREGKYAQWAQGARQDIARYEARGVITEDGENWSDYGRLDTATGTATWGTIGWCGREDLARKLTEGKQADGWRETRIYTVAGELVGSITRRAEALAKLPPVADLAVGGGGTVYTVIAGTDAGREWLALNIGLDAHWHGAALVVEHRYIADIVEGARADGLIVR